MSKTINLRKVLYYCNVYGSEPQTFAPDLVEAAIEELDALTSRRVRADGVTCVCGTKLDKGFCPNVACEFNGFDCVTQG